ncbi:hypothetical protein QCA50_003124 [Cerrena zonata]|uniref:Uncharacterized protein n=1 Tax=Cerrena zonata TaxID=2478898 RepID=A0AAW0GJS3_9APHY
MLFRPPPPYDTSKSSTPPSTSSVRRSLKRHRSESAMKTLFGNDARNTKKARESVESVMNLVGKKAEIAATDCRPFQMCPEYP